MKQIIFFLLIFNSVYGQNLNGRFEGAVTRDGSIQLLNLEFYVENGVQKGTYEIPDIGIFEAKIDELKLKMIP